MEMNRALDALSALAQPTRLAAFRRLVAAGPDGVAAGDLADALGVPAPTLSNALNVLANAGLVSNRRDGRSIIYAAEMAAMNALLDFLMNDCCGGHPDLCRPEPVRKACAMDDRPLNVLFLCTANSARSLIAEAILNADSSGRFRAWSAGSHPASHPNPRTLQLLNRLGYDTARLRSKSWDAFATPEAPKMDFVFTVCDNAAGKVCPVWPGQPVTAHWGVPDPAAVTGTEAERAAAFAATHKALATRLSAFTALPFATLKGKSLQARLDRIGETRD